MNHIYTFMKNVTKSIHNLKFPPHKLPILAMFLR